MVNKGALPPKKLAIFASYGLLAVGLLGLSGCPADGEACSGDLDCPNTPPQACVEGRCEDLGFTDARACEEDTDCPGDAAHAACVDKKCRIAPACQRIRGDFSLVVECAGEVRRGTASFENVGCVNTANLTLTGGTPPFSGATLAFEAGRDNEVTLQGSGNVSGCAASGWSAAESRLALEDCTMPGGATCDLGLVLTASMPGSEQACLAGVAIAAQSCLAACENGALEVGTCRAN
jgi:hypothetical protein